MDEKDLDLGYTSKGVLNEEFKVDEMIQNYMFGIDLSDSDGNPFPEHILIHHLNSAIHYAERILGIQIGVTEEEEYHDYHMSDYMNWGFIQLYKYPALEIEELCMMYGNKKGFVVPNDWIQLDKLTGKVSLFPNHGTANSLIISSGGTILGLHTRWSYAPQMWYVKYKAGLDTVPADLYELVYKKATISILQVWGDLILGAGIASQSVSIDGLSQSIGTTQSAMFGGASARCDEYRKDIDRLLPALKSKYTGIKMIVV